MLSAGGKARHLHRTHSLPHLARSPASCWPQPSREGNKLQSPSCSEKLKWTGTSGLSHLLNHLGKSCPLFSFLVEGTKAGKESSRSVHLKPKEKRLPNEKTRLEETLPQSHNGNQVTPAPLLQLCSHPGVKGMGGRRGRRRRDSQRIYALSCQDRTKAAVTTYRHEACSCLLSPLRSPAHTLGR